MTVTEENASTTTTNNNNNVKENGTSTQTASTIMKKENNESKAKKPVDMDAMTDLVTKKFSNNYNNNNSNTVTKISTNNNTAISSSSPVSKPSPQTTDTTNTTTATNSNSTKEPAIATTKSNKPIDIDSSSRSNESSPSSSIVKNKKTNELRRSKSAPMDDQQDKNNNGTMADNSIISAPVGYNKPDNVHLSSPLSAPICVDDYEFTETGDESSLLITSPDTSFILATTTTTVVSSPSAIGTPDKNQPSTAAKNNSKDENTNYNNDNQNHKPPSEVQYYHANTNNNNTADVQAAFSGEDSIETAEELYLMEQAAAAAQRKQQQQQQEQKEKMIILSTVGTSSDDGSHRSNGISKRKLSTKQSGSSADCGEIKSKYERVASTNKFLHLKDPNDISMNNSEHNSSSIKKDDVEEELLQYQRDPTREYVNIPDDAYNMFFLSNLGGPGFFLPFYVFALKIAMFTFLALDAVKTVEERDGRAGIDVLIAQFLMLPIAVAMQSDLMTTYFMLANLKYCKSIQNKNPGAKKWKYHISLFCRAADGFYSLMVNFIVLVSAENVLGMFLNFAALQFLQTIDDIAVELCEQGFLFDRLEELAILVKEAELPRRHDMNKLRSLDTISFLLTCLLLIVLWVYFAFYAETDGGEESSA